MKSFLSRFLCHHLNWKKGRPLDQAPHHNDYATVIGKGQIVPWTCTRCGKTKQFTNVNPPIQHFDGT